MIVTEDHTLVRGSYALTISRGHHRSKVALRIVNRI
jgi:hypothetical protein